MLVLCLIIVLTNMAVISLYNVSKSYSTNIGWKEILKNVTFEIRDGEFVTLFGPNGCGKTTLLNIIAGVTQQDHGKVTINGKFPNKDIIGYVFQNYRDSLLPWKTNIENIAFPLEIKHVPKEKRLALAEELVRSFELTLPLYKYPYQCSGGEQQLVAILREVIAHPNIILMDEPFSALDVEHREYLRVKVQEIAKKLHLTVMFVSHDIYETLQLGDRVFILDPEMKTISKILEVNAPRPRTEKILYSKTFKHLVSYMRGILK